jgi:hypothetical protein
MNRIASIGLSLFLTSCAANAQSSKIVSFDKDHLMARKVSGEDTIAPPRGVDYFGDVDIEVTIQPDGSVSEAHYPADDYRGLSKNSAAAVQAVRGWKFKPLEYRGTPVIAQGTVSIDYLAEPLKVENAEFDPATFDYTNFKATLQRTACFGSCPDYEVTILGTGQVQFDPDPRQANDEAGIHRAFSPDSGMLVPLKNVDNIDRAKVNRLIAAIYKTNFFKLKNSYEAGITDSPTYVVTVTMNGKAKTVTDYVGKMAGMPETVSALEDLIDEVAGTSRWIDGTAGFFNALKNANFDFKSKHSAALAVLIANSVHSSDIDIINMIEAGLPLDEKFALQRMGEAETLSNSGTAVGSELLSASISSGKASLTAYLIDLGWMQRTPKDMLDNAIAASGQQCNLAATELAIKSGLSPNAKDSDGKTGLLQLVSGYPSCSDDLPKFLQTLKKWIELGADVNAADNEGNTAIFGLEKLDALEILLENGADPTHKDKEGRSAAFSSWQDAIVLRLLEAGADPAGKDDDGRTLKAQAKKRGDMPGTTAWLAARKTSK